MTTTAYAASEKMIGFATRLIAERAVPADTVIETGWKASKQQIDWLLRQPKKAAAPAKAAAAPATEKVGPGVYVAPNGDVIKVQQTKDKQRVYAKVLVHINGKRLTLTDEVVDFDFVYTPGLINHITPDMKMTAEQAMDFGIKTGRCIRCKRHLKAAKSVAAALGPVCITYFA